MQHIVVLGAGFGGSAAAYRLRKLLDNQIEILVIADSDSYVYRPSLPEVALGQKSVEEIRVPLAKALPRKGIGFVKGRVQEISPSSCSVDTDAGRFDYDYLVVALGSEIAFDEVAGAREYGHVLCEADYIMKLREALNNFERGSLSIILTPDNPFELMDIGFTFALEHQLRKRGVRGSTKIHYFTPYRVILPHLGEKARGIIRGIFTEKGIEVHTEMYLQEVKSESLLFQDGKEFTSHLSVLIPPYRGRQVVARSGLGDERGLISTDEEMKSLKFDNIYVVGDALWFEGPKSARRAVIQGKVTAQSIAGRIKGHRNSAKFDERELRCIMEVGGNKAAYIRSNTFWGGTSERVWIGRIPYWMKVWLEKRFLFKNGDI